MAKLGIAVPVPKTGIEIVEEQLRNNSWEKVRIVPRNNSIMEVRAISGRRLKDAQQNQHPEQDRSPLQAWSL